MTSQTAPVTASGTITTGDRRPEVAERSAVGICCRNSAAMLHLADGDSNSTPQRRRDFQELNRKQAALLLAAAEIVDEMLAALQAADALWSKDKLLFAEEMSVQSPVGIVWARIRAAIARATP